MPLPLPTPGPGPSGDPAAVRLSRPGEIAEVVPLLCGFVPTESLVVVSLRGRSGQVGLTQRVDLPPPQAGRAVARDVAVRVRADGARAAVVTVWTDAEPEPGPAAGRDGGPEGAVLPGSPVAAAVRRALRRQGVDVPVRLLIGRGRWWSYDCSAACCPPEGTPLTAVPSAAADAVRAQGALAGRAVLPSRDALVAALLPPDPVTVVPRLAATAAARERRIAVEGRVAVGRACLAQWRRALARAPQPDAAGGPAGAAQLVVSLADQVVRDTVAGLALEDDAALLGLLLQLAAASCAPFDVPVCTLVGWVAHARGDGALANVALDRALDGDPTYGLARLCRVALDGQVAPRQVRELLADARMLLHRQHPWTAVGTVTA